MNLKFFHGNINRNYSWELELFTKHRDFKFGITPFKFEIDFSIYPCDHNPKFEMELVIMNFSIFQFLIYNIWHMENEHSPYYGLSETEVETLDASYHSRKTFYNGKDIYWYKLFCDGVPISSGTEHHVPWGFLKIPETEYYEYGGSHNDAIIHLKLSGFNSIMEGDEI